jgi:hypothetical protein
MMYKYRGGVCKKLISTLSMVKPCSQPAEQATA